MKKLLFFGDSITDMSRVRESNDLMQYGYGYVFLIAEHLLKQYPNKYKIINKGIGGNTILDLYERYQKDVINEKPDVITILIGVNDIWHKIDNPTDTRYSELPRFIELYEKMIIDIKNKLPEARIILMEPYVLKGSATLENNKYEQFCEVFKYAKAIENLAIKYKLTYVRLQKELEKGQRLYGEQCLSDGVHPNIAGASIISTEWLKLFN